MELIVPFLTLKVHKHTHAYHNPEANKLPDTFTLKSKTGQRCVYLCHISFEGISTIRQGGKSKRIRIEKGKWETSSQEKNLNNKNSAK